MKRIISITIILITCLCLISCADQEKENEIKQITSYLQEEIPSVLYDNITLPSCVSITTLKNETFDLNLTYYLDGNGLLTDGTIVPSDTESTVTLMVGFIYNDEECIIEVGTVTIPSKEAIINNIIEFVKIADTAEDEIMLPISVGIVGITWSSSDRNVITPKGIVNKVTDATDVTLTACFSINNSSGYKAITKDYNVFVKGMINEEVFEEAIKSVELPSEVSAKNIVLPTDLGYGVTGSWSSSNESIISSSGVVTRQTADEVVKLTLTMTRTKTGATKTKEYTVKVLKKDEKEEMDLSTHNFIKYAGELNLEDNDSLELVDNKITLKEGKLEGTYTSPIISTYNFTQAVGSYSCITDTTCSCEYEISVRVDGAWSAYFSYGKFSFGKQNGCSNMTSGNAYLDQDSILFKNSKSADAMRIRFTLRRDSLSSTNPKLSLIAVALTLKDYTYNVDKTKIKSSVDYDVPKLLQHQVSSIGSSICSPTTTTMLIKWAGYTIDKGSYSYEHEYIAYMAKDYGNGIFGNWSYCMITAGSLGANAYVGYCTSLDEFKYILSTKGPIGCSIKGYWGYYTTGGHLIVARGYRENADGTTTIICNDPNYQKNGGFVYYEVDSKIFMNAWRNIYYMVEKKA